MLVAVKSWQSGARCYLSIASTTTKAVKTTLKQ